MKYKIGKFYISNKEMKDLESMVSLFSYLKFVPLRVELLAYNMKYELYGISKLFDDVPEGFNTPEYDIQITKDISGKFHSAILTKKQD